MLDAIVITIGIVGITASLLYKLLLLAYRADKRTAAPHPVLPMPLELTLRNAQPSDAPAVAHLIGGLAHYFLADPAAAEAGPFLENFSIDAVTRCIADPAIDYVVACVGTELVGVAALRGQTHVHHLFVRADLHGQGIARGLWQRLKAGAGDTTHFTVNSSLYAVPTYAAFGFAPTAEVQARNGVRYQPMALQEA